MHARSVLGFLYRNWARPDFCSSHSIPTYLRRFACGCAFAEFYPLGHDSPDKNRKHSDKKENKKQPYERIVMSHIIIVSSCLTRVNSILRIWTQYLLLDWTVAVYHAVWSV